MNSSPLLRDAHLHIAQLGEELSHLNLADCASLDEALQHIASAAASVARHSVPGSFTPSPSGRGQDEGYMPSPAFLSSSPSSPQASSLTPQAAPWLIAAGARAESWPERRLPTARELHDATGGQAVIVRSFDHHAIAVSSRALELAGITRETPNPPHGVIDRDPITRRPTGLLLEHACNLIWNILPAPSLETRTNHVHAALAELARHNLVELHDMLATPDLARILLDLEHRGELTQRIHLYATREHFDALFAMTEPPPSRGTGVPPVSTPTPFSPTPSYTPHPISGSRLITLAGLKIFTDGTLNSRTAHMLHPFNNPIPNHPHGTPMMSPADIAESIAFADSRGLPIAAHAIGDAAVRTTLDAIEQIKPRTQGQRIEHAQFIDEADIPRFAQLNVIASMQPCHLLTDMEAVERFTPHRAHRAFPLRDLIDAAKHANRNPVELIMLGSDAPIVPPDPADNIQAAVHRRRAEMPHDRAIAAQQSITHEEVDQLSHLARS